MNCSKSTMLSYCKRLGEYTGHNFVLLAAAINSRFNDKNEDSGEFVKEKLGLSRRTRRGQKRMLIRERHPAVASCR